jgi:hypothetical protein
VYCIDNDESKKPHLYAILQFKNYKQSQQLALSKIKRKIEIATRKTHLNCLPFIMKKINTIDNSSATNNGIYLFHSSAIKKYDEIYNKISKYISKDLIMHEINS